MPLRLSELAVRFGCELRGDPDAAVERVAPLAEAGPGDLAFLANPRYRRHLAGTRATAVVLDATAVDGCPTSALVTRNPYATYARIAQLLHPLAPTVPGRDASAVVEDGAIVDESAWIGAQSFIARGVRIGPRVHVGPGCVVLANASIGADSRLVARVTICEDARLGQRCVVHPGAVIGADGFGHAPDSGGYVKVPQLGAVAIGDDVDIGCNTTIDRGAIGDTVIANGVKIDNLVQVGHNVHIGEHTVIAACSGISGSAVIGRRCMLGGMVGVVGHLEICDDVAVTGRTMVSSSIRRPGVYSSGLPAEEAARFRRNAARFRTLDELAKRVRRLEGGAAPGEEKDDDDE
jgi:UDP-3-O-[3-hydroxymyristoyl] glucosamine N-acyltransferase